MQSMYCTSDIERAQMSVNSATRSRTCWSCSGVRSGLNSILARISATQSSAQVFVVLGDVLSPRSSLNGGCSTGGFGMSSCARAASTCSGSKHGSWVRQSHSSSVRTSMLNTESCAVSVWVSPGSSLGPVVLSSHSSLVRTLIPYSVSVGCVSSSSTRSCGEGLQSERVCSSFTRMMFSRHLDSHSLCTSVSSKGG